MLSKPSESQCCKLQHPQKLYAKHQKTKFAGKSSRVRTIFMQRRKSTLFTTAGFDSSDQIPLTQQTGRNLDDRVHFSTIAWQYFSSIVHVFEFSSIVYTTRALLTLFQNIVYISRLSLTSIWRKDKYTFLICCITVLDNRLHFSIHFCPVQLAI